MIKNVASILEGWEKSQIYDFSEIESEPLNISKILKLIEALIKQNDKKAIIKAEGEKFNFSFEAIEDT